jgi:hypothetical protein
MGVTVMLTANLPDGCLDALASRDKPCGFAQLLDDFLYCVSFTMHGV